MGRVTIRRLEDLEPTRARDNMPPERQARYSDGELNSVKRSFFPVEGESLQLFEMTHEPNAESQSHAHSSAEIIYITEGELHFGAQVCRAGTAIYIDADTLYAFKAGAEGAKFLNFRGDPLPQYIFKEDFLEYRKSAQRPA